MITLSGRNSSRKNELAGGGDHLPIISTGYELYFIIARAAFKLAAKCLMRLSRRSRSFHGFSVPHLSPFVQVAVTVKAVQASGAGQAQVSWQKNTSKPRRTSNIVMNTRVDPVSSHLPRQSTKPRALRSWPKGVRPVPRRHA